MPRHFSQHFGIFSTNQTRGLGIRILIVAKNTKGKYPAPVSILKCIKTGVEQAPRPNPHTHCAHSPAGARLT